MKRKKKDRIDHLDDVDVFVDPKPLTDAEREMLSAYLKTKREKDATGKRVTLEVSERKVKYKSAKTKSLKRVGKVKLAGTLIKKKKT